MAKCSQNMQQDMRDGNRQGYLYRGRKTGAMTGSLLGGTLGIVLPFTGIEYFNMNKAAKATMTTAVGAAAGALIGTAAGHGAGLVANRQWNEKNEVGGWGQWVAKNVEMDALVKE